jgi:hypothetical protein
VFLDAEWKCYTAIRVCDWPVFKTSRIVLVGRLYPANHYPLIPNIFLQDSFCCNNLNSRLAYQYGVQKVLRCLCHTSRISQGTSAVGLTRHSYFRNCCHRNYCYPPCSAFLLHGIWDNAWVHWRNLWMQRTLGLSCWRWR